VLFSISSKAAQAEKRGTLMLHSSNIKARILHAWEKDKEQVLKDLGGIEQGHRNEARIQQIEQTIKSLKYAFHDNNLGNLGKR
jgi:hypothetical protein